MKNPTFFSPSLNGRCYGNHFLTKSAKFAYCTFLHCTGVLQNVLKDQNADAKRLNGNNLSTLSVCLSVCLCALSPGRNDVLFAEKCIRLVCEKLTIFPYGQDIVGNVVLLAF